MNDHVDLQATSSSGTNGTMISPNMTSSVSDELLNRPLNSDTVQAVLGFLRKHNLTDAEESLLREAGGVLRSENASGLPPEEAISVEFDTFAKHGLTAPDIVQVEYNQLLFPVFAHSYISLVERRSTKAKKFFDDYKIHIPECFSEYVYRLSLVEDLVTLRACEHVQTLRDNKFSIKISRATSKHVDTVLARLIGIKNILAKHVVTEIFEPTPKNQSTIETQMGGILGQIGRNEKKHKMYYAVVKDDVMQNIEKKKLRQKDFRDGMKKMMSLAPMADRIPLPPTSERLREEKRVHQREVVKMAIISADSPPSICMYTTLNAPIGVSACDFSDDSTMIVMGLADSSIVVNSMDPMSKIKKMRDMEHLDKIDLETAENIEQQMFDLQASTSLVRFSGHGATVFSVNLAPDRRLLLSSSGDKTVRLWSMDTQKNVVIHRTPGVIWDAQFCNRGYYFATGSSDKTAAIWCTDRMQPIRLFADAFSDVGCVDYHPNCNYVAGGSDDRYVRVWDVLSGTCVRTFCGHKSNIIAIKFSPDGRYLVSLDSVGNLMIWDMSTQRLVAAELTEQKGTKGSITFSRDGGVFAVSHGNTNITIYALDVLNQAMASNALTDWANEPKINMEGLKIGSYPTKQTAVIGLHFTRRNLLMAFGCFGQ